MDSVGGELIPALPPLVDEAVLARRDLVFLERTMDDSGATHPIRVGGVSFGRVESMQLGPDDLPPAFFRRVWAKRSRHLLLVIPFDLLELPDEHRYVWVSVRCRLEDPPGYALQIKPGRQVVSVPVDAEARARLYSSGLDGGEQADGRAAGGNQPPTPEDGRLGVDWETEFTTLAAELDGQLHRRGPLPPPATELRPLVTTFGQGKTEFGWRLDSQPGYPLWYQNVIGGVLIEVPKETTEVTGILTAEAVVRRPWLDEPVPVDARTTVETPFRVPLD